MDTLLGIVLSIIIVDAIIYRLSKSLVGKIFGYMYKTTVKLVQYGYEGTKLMYIKLDKRTENLRLNNRKQQPVVDLDEEISRRKAK